MVPNDGGRNLTFDSMTGLMAVNNSEQVHRKVAEVIETLRQATPPERLRPAVTGEGSVVAPGMGMTPPGVAPPATGVPKAK